MIIIAIFNDISESIGLDIGSGSIKAVKLKKNKDDIELSGAAFVELPPLRENEQDGRKKRVEEALRKVLKEIGSIKGNSVSIATHGSSVYIRYIKLPPVDTSRITQIVRYEAQQQIPLPLEEVIWDYQILKKEALGIEVVLVATKLELINKLLKETTASVIEPDVIDYSPLAFYNCFDFNEESPKEETLVLLDIGTTSTDMSIKRGNHLCWTRSIPVGSDDITQAIQQSLGLNLLEAEKAKKEKIITLDDEQDAFSKTVISVLSRLVGDVERSLTFCQAELGGLTVNRVVLSGGGAQLLNLDKFLEKELGIKVIKISSLKNIRLPDNFPFPGREVAFAVAVGLALRPLRKCRSEINFLPPDLSGKKAFRKKKKYFILSFALAFLITGLGYAFTVHDYGIRKARLEYIESEFGKYRKYEDPIRELSQETGEVTQKIESLKDLSKRKDFWIEALLEISRLVPDRVKLNSFSQNTTGTLTLEGEASAIQDIIDFVSRLESSPLFGKVEAGTPEKLSAIDGETEESYRFILENIPLPSFPFPKDKLVREQQEEFMMEYHHPSRKLE